MKIVKKVRKNNVKNSWKDENLYHSLVGLDSLYHYINIVSHPARLMVNNALMALPLRT